MVKKRFRSEKSKKYEFEIETSILHHRNDKHIFSTRTDFYSPFLVIFISLYSIIMQKSYP